MATDRDLQNILNSGEINSIFIDGATSSDKVLKSSEVDTAVSSGIAPIEATLAATPEPTGFDRRDSQYLGIIECCPFASEQIVHRIDEDGNYTKLTGQTTFGDGVTLLSDRTMAIRPGVSGEYHVWLDGTKFVKTATETITVGTPTAGVIIFYYDMNGDLQWGAAPIDDIFSSYASVAVVTCNTVEQKRLLFRDERHGNTMAGITHEYLHRTQGTQYASGADISGLADNGTTFTQVTEGTFYDEDLQDIAALQSNMPFWFREGVNGQWNSSDLVNNELGYKPLGATQYNLNTGGTWSLENIGNSYVIMHIIYSGDTEYPYVKVIGQNLYADRTTARRQLNAEISNLQLDGMPSPEFKFLYSMIIHNESSGQIETGTDGEIYVDWRFGFPTSRY